MRGTSSVSGPDTTRNMLTYLPGDVIASKTAQRTCFKSLENWTATVESLRSCRQNVIVTTPMSRNSQGCMQKPKTCAIVTRSSQRQCKGWPCVGLRRPPRFGRTALPLSAGDAGCPSYWVQSPRNSKRFASFAEFILFWETAFCRCWLLGSTIPSRGSVCWLRSLDFCQIHTYRACIACIPCRSARVRS